LVDASDGEPPRHPQKGLFVSICQADRCEQLVVVLVLANGSCTFFDSLSHVQQVEDSTPQKVGTIGNQEETGNRLSGAPWCGDLRGCRRIICRLGIVNVVSSNGPIPGASYLDQPRFM